ncbi:MAG: outer membrane protein assembly factor BamD [Cellulophaga sp.]|nr:outer membrane protein assembly factor BamD [Cellulophaga sp.]
MFRKLRAFFSALVLLLIFTSCSDYQKVLKNEDIKAKYDLAEKLYETEDFKRANVILEQISPKYIGKPQGERVMFFLSNSYFQTKDYSNSGYYFERFLKSYPKSDKAQEAAFLGAKSYYLLSPNYSLDQTDTDKALLKLQLFINEYPNSEFLPQANEMAQDLTEKKEKKAFEIAKQFTKLGEFFKLDYSISAAAALDNFMLDFPGSVYKEDALFYKLKALSNLALNSSELKKRQRLGDAKQAYDVLKKNFPQTQFESQATDIVEKINKELENYSK